MSDEAKPYTLDDVDAMEVLHHRHPRLRATVKALDAAEAERDDLRKSLASVDAARLVELKRAEKAEATLVARHGGEPLALLAELDAARAEVERLREALKASRRPRHRTGHDAETERRARGRADGRGGAAARCAARTS